MASTNQAVILQIFKAILFLICVWISQQHAEKLWVVGPVFGALVLFWDWQLTRKFHAAFYAGFLIASTFIYALVAWMVLGNLMQNGLPEYVVPGVVVGTMLLPLAHHIFLGISWRRVWLAIVCIYPISIVAGIISTKIKLAEPLNIFLSATGFWQSAYLLFMFAGRKTLPQTTRMKSEN